MIGRRHMDELFARYGIDAESPEAFVRLLRQLPPADRAELETELAVHANYALDAHMHDDAMDVRKLGHKIDCFVRELQPYRQYLDVAIEREKIRLKWQNAVIEKTATAIIWTALSGLAVAVWFAMKEYVKQLAR